MATKGAIVITASAASLVGMQNFDLTLVEGEKTRTAGLTSMSTEASAADAGRLHPDVCVVGADLAEPGSLGGTLWPMSTRSFSITLGSGARSDEKPFIDNNINATRNVLHAAKRYGVRQVVHVSSSVVNSPSARFLYRDEESSGKACRRKWPWRLASCVRP